MSIEVEKITAYYPEGGLPAPDKQQRGVNYVHGPQPGPDMTEKQIEDHDLRLHLPKEVANICISVMPGDRLGELRVNVQYEGRSGERELCMNGQNNLMHRVSEYLRNVLHDKGSAGDWKIVIDAQPCNKTEVQCQLAEAARKLEGTEQAAFERAATTQQVDVDQINENKRNLNRTL